MEHNHNNALNEKLSASAPTYRGSLGYLVIGGAIGATLALLFAPKSGQQLRGDLADVSRKGLETARDKARVINEKTGELAQSVKEKADAAYSYAARKVGAESTEPTERAASAAISWAENNDSKPTDLDKNVSPRPAMG